MSADEHNDLSSAVMLGYTSSIIRRAKLMETMLYAVEKLESIAKRISAAALLRARLESFDEYNGLFVKPKKCHIPARYPVPSRSLGS